MTHDPKTETQTRFLWLCLHKWKQIDRHGEFYSDQCVTSTDRRPCAIIYVLQCERCGDVKQRRI